MKSDKKDPEDNLGLLDLEMADFEQLCWPLVDSPQSHTEALEWINSAFDGHSDESKLIDQPTD